MEIVFLGVGEAFDEDFLNSSIIIRSNTNIMLDCGFAITSQFWKYCSDPNFLDIIYISHTHADHYFALPALLTKMWSDGRTKPLMIISPKGSKHMILSLIELGYEGFLAKFGYEIDFKEADANQEIKVEGILMNFAKTSHSSINFAVRISEQGKAICYSGDGNFNPDTKELYQGADLVIHDAYHLRTGSANHSGIGALLKIADKTRIKCLALIHIKKQTRRDTHVILNHISKSGVNAIIPNNLDVIKL
ncbi:MAG: ribonuclease Z [Nanoarchaeota archaeon]|nr:ribonuclease Z [Nanoarchaeota archaeon]MBU1704622.1 ribonuclease Z [Nanoarchaeota archaeon]